MSQTNSSTPTRVSIFTTANERPANAVGFATGDLLIENPAAASDAAPNVSLVRPSNSSPTLLGYQNIIRTGRFTLVAGFLVVADPRITASSKFLGFTNVNTNASVQLGVLMANTIIPGVSFQVISIDPATGVGPVVADGSTHDYAFTG